MLLQAFDGGNHSLHPIGPEDIKIQKPRLHEWEFGLGPAEDAVYGISQQDLEMVDELEGCGTELRVPFMESDC